MVSKVIRDSGELEALQSGLSSREVCGFQPKGSVSAWEKRERQVLRIYSESTTSFTTL
jgi:hypothetical protein